VAKFRLLIIGIVFCLALSMCCDGHVEGLRPKHVVVLYAIGGLPQNKEYLLLLSVMVRHMHCSMQRCKITGQEYI
jgi:hypothetical protein